MSRGTGGGEADRQRWLFAATLALVIYGMLELSALITLTLLHRLRGLEYDPILVDALTVKQRTALEALVAGRSGYFRFHPDLGWTIKPDGVHEGLYRANGQGLRGDRDYDVAPPADRIRFAAFGDSFTHSDEVRNPGTWEAQLEASDPSFEVLNFGVPAFGMDQAFLRYQLDGIAYHPDIVFIGFMSENIQRHVNVYRPFYSPGTHMPMTKPRYALDLDSLRLWPNPLRDLDGYRALMADPATVLPAFGVRDFFYQHAWRRSRFDILPSVRLFRLARTELAPAPGAIIRDGYYNERSEAFQVTARLFDAFAALVRRQGSIPLILIFPNRSDFLRYGATGTQIYRPLLAYLDRQGLAYVDLMAAFKEHLHDPIDRLLPSHLTDEGNRLIAVYLRTYLHEHGLADLGEVRRHRKRGQAAFEPRRAAATCCRAGPSSRDPRASSADLPRARPPAQGS
jgi:hypothetical protein